MTASINNTLKEEHDLTLKLYVNGCGYSLCLEEVDNVSDTYTVKCEIQDIQDQIEIHFLVFSHFNFVCFNVSHIDLRGIHIQVILLLMLAPMYSICFLFSFIFAQLLCRINCLLLNVFQDHLTLFSYLILHCHVMEFLLECLILIMEPVSAVRSLQEAILIRLSII